MTTNRALQPTPVICLLHHYLVLPISIFNIKPHLDAFEVGLLLLWLESVCNHVSSAMAYTPFPVAIALRNLAER
ncbi:hypothetical protein [Nostoc sp.]|uniref:hypothetical protein n=1 Tax=Nostoc sp. TaxID=1180 RepID=UPI002FF894C0